ncbi:hypothetical protein [Aureimonas sp. Leaf324]|uniref:hypothetical protein n=1 Tax=Aureimonas sp. Leaf324 TaxID=1736336 RepID=UPI0006FE53FE|nr:hypothetical protein [Aureimonas sp. Leaf324]KQQ90988.1 hypothetical protein ASF65_00140 [Aureimonas sp. Leaf324]
MGWIECKARDLVIGDAILLTRRVEIKGENGRYVQGTVRQKDKATGTWLDAKGRQKVDWRHTARVLDILANAGDPAVVIERIDDHPPKEAGAVRPLAVEQIPFRVLDWSSMKLRRHTDHGPTQRTNSHGRFFLLQMIREAAGGDETNEQAIGRLSLCVRRGDIDEAETSGSLPARIGRSNAIGMLKDERLFSEAAVRQLTGRMSLPDSRNVPDLGHEGLGTSFSRSRTDHTFKDPDDGRPIIIFGKDLGYVQPADPSDPEVTAILEAMPDAEVRILTHPTREDMIRLRRHFAPKASDAVGEVPGSDESDADGEESVNYADTSIDE